MTRWLFQPSTPSDVEPKTWEPAHSRRTTMELLQTCVGTLLLCTWTVLHLDIPKPKQRDSVWRLAATKVLWMFRAMIMPEYVLDRASDQFWLAREICLELRKPQMDREQGPTKIDLPGHEPESPVLDSQHKELSWLQQIVPPNLQFGFYILMGGYQVVETDTDTGKVKLVHGALTLGAAIRLYREGRLPVVSPTDIKDKSKAGALDKVLVCLQISWLILQCSARKATGLPITLLEINTMMHILATVLMYIAWFHKPLNIMYPCNIEYAQLKTSLPGDSTIFTKYAYDSLKISCPSMASTNFKYRRWTLAIQYTLYGGIHLTQLHAHFPTNLERMLWIAFSSFLLGAGFGVNILNPDRYNWTKRPTRGRRLLSTCMNLACNILDMAIPAASSYLVVESFISLRSLPAGSYIAVKWAEAIPHI